MVYFNQFGWFHQSDVETELLNPVAHRFPSQLQLAGSLRDISLGFFKGPQNQLPFHFFDIYSFQTKLDFNFLAGGNGNGGAVAGFKPEVVWLDNLRSEERRVGKECRL